MKPHPLKPQPHPLIIKKSETTWILLTSLMLSMREVIVMLVRVVRVGTGWRERERE